MICVEHNPECPCPLCETLRIEKETESKIIDAESSEKGK
jgi:hypothetical protein